PSARAVRFYVASGLLDRPEGTGTGATYGYRHLLQLLAIKIRQREGQSLDTIKTEMRDVTGDALERKIAQSLAPALTSGADQIVANDDDMSLRRCSRSAALAATASSGVSQSATLNLLPRASAAIAMRPPRVTSNAPDPRG